MPAAAMPTVTELGEALALPRAAPASVHALNRLYSQTGPMALTLREQPHRLRFTHRDAPSPIATDVFRFRLGAHVGTLGIDTLAAAWLFGERRSELLPRDLRYVLLADALHPIAEALERALRVRFEWSPPAAGEASAGAGADPSRAARFDVEGPDGAARLHGFVQFDDEAALDAVVSQLPRARPLPADTLEWLRVPVPFVIGRTRVSLRELGLIVPGDIIGIEEWASIGEALQVQADWGGTPGRVLLGVAEGSRITIQPPKDSDMNRDPSPSPAPGDDNEAANLPLDRLDSLEVSLRFEVGDLSLSLGELKNVRAGHVFELAQPLNRSPVRIVAHGNVLGKGHLVAVGDRLGVRVSEFAPSEI